MNCICAWKFVRSSYIGGDISGQNYLEDTISKLRLETDAKIEQAYISTLHSSNCKSKGCINYSRLTVVVDATFGLRKRTMEAEI
jgi:hypothetical protein